MNPAYGFEWKAVSESTTIEGSFAAPTTFFAARGTGLNGSIYSWLDHEDRTLWREEEKSDYDPCPAGYRLPEPDDWGDWNEKLVPASDLSGGTYTYNGNTAWFPVSGCGRAYDTGECIRGMKSQFMLWNGRVTMRNDIAPGRPEFDEYFPSRVIKGLEGSISNVKPGRSGVSTPWPTTASRTRHAAWRSNKRRPNTSRKGEPGTFPGSFFSSCGLRPGGFAGRIVRTGRPPAAGSARGRTADE